ncbi:unnamed protein product [Choristocarpus tenellus]
MTGNQENITHEERFGFWSRRSTEDLVYRLLAFQEVGQEKYELLWSCVVLTYRKNHCVDRDLFWTMLARFGVSEKMVSFVRQVHECRHATALMESVWIGLRLDRVFGKGVFLLHPVQYLLTGVLRMTIMDFICDSANSRGYCRHQGSCKNQPGQRRRGHREWDNT